MDPVTRYATDVCAGRIVACRMVTLACARHLRDLQQAPAKGWVWDAEKAQRVIDFFADELILPENTDSDEDPVDDEAGELEPRPFILTPFEQFIAGSLFGWHAHRTNKRGVRRLVRRFRVGYLEIGKGNGKTPFAAGIMVYLLVGDGVRGAQVFSAAVTLAQAKQYGFTDAVKMVEASSRLKARVEVLANQLSVLETGSFMRPISSEKKGLDGKRVHGVMIDEEHEHPSDDVYVKMRAGTKGRSSALVLVITNSGFNPESVCGRHHDYTRQVLDGTVVNDTWFGFVCHLDSCEACYAAGKWQPSDDCAACDDWRVEGPHWLKPNPNLGVTIQWEYLREQVQEAIGIPSQRNMVRRLNFCQWTQQATAWIPSEQWTDCKGDVSPTSLAGRECYAGVDLSDKIDLSSVVLIFPREMNRAQTTDAVVAADATDAPPLDRAIDVLPYFWMPKQSIERRAHEDGVPYPQWAKDGWLTATQGALVDHDAIVDFLIEAATTYHLRGIGFDQAGATAAVTRLQRHFGDAFVTEIPQSFRMLSEPAKTMEALIVSRNLAHDANPVMTMCMGNMAIEENRWREIRPVKIGQRKRIDGGVALIVAVKALQVTPDAPASSVEVWA